MLYTITYKSFRHGLCFSMVHFDQGASLDTQLVQAGYSGERLFD
jgi:hypothetical protein